MPDIYVEPKNINKNKPNVCLFRPHGYNLGDMMHFRGLKVVLDAAFPPQERNTYHIFAEEFIDDKIIQRIRNRFSHIIVCGTPWFWWDLEPSFRYGEFRKVLNANKGAKKYAFAIGASYPIEYQVRFARNIGSTAPIHIKNRQIIKDVWGEFNKIVTRDQLSVDILRDAGIRAEKMICSSVFANDAHKVKRKYTDYKLLVYFSIMDGHSTQYLTKEYVHDYYTSQYRFATEHKPKVVCINDKEVESYEKYASEVGINPNQLPPIESLQAWSKFDTWTAEKKLLELLSEASVVVSGRVHAGIPARSLGVPVVILPADTRGRCVVDAGGMAAFHVSQLRHALKACHKQEPLNIKQFRRQYFSIVKGVFGR